MQRIVVVCIMLVLACGWTDKVYAEEIAGGVVTDTNGEACGELMWSLDDEGVMRISGEGPGESFKIHDGREFYELRPWHEYCEQIKEVRFECVFSGTSHFNLNEGTSLAGWFANCVNLKKCSDLPEGVNDISWLFYECSSLEKCGIIPDSVTTMQYTFAYCSSLEISPEFSSGLKDNAFQYELGKTGLIAPYVRALSYTYCGCSNLVVTPSFQVLKGKVSYYTGTFKDCVNLVTIQPFPFTKVILNETFVNCRKAEGLLDIPSNEVTIIGNPFENIATDTEYILFLSDFGHKIYDKLKELLGDESRVCYWEIAFPIFLKPNAPVSVKSGNVIICYGLKYTGEFDEDLKAKIDDEYYRYSGKIYGELPIPQYSEKVFLGWYHDEELTIPVNSDDVINPINVGVNNMKDILYAKWRDYYNPDVKINNLTTDWRNDVHEMEVLVNAEAGIKNIQLYREVEAGWELHTELDLNDIKPNEYVWNLTLGDAETKLYEGISNWKVYVEDIYGNFGEEYFELKLDYTAPNIYTDIIGDLNQEIVMDKRDVVITWAKDYESGMKILKINPSNYQNDFVNTIITPSVTSGEFEIEYQYPQNDEYGYVLLAKDMAGNIASRVIITDYIIKNRLKRIIPRGNYD